ncbi:porin family protein [Paracoccus methylovorus]|uniref:Porin family protein n=3 Tax=Paracoccus TaxID=265 RepID=A0A7H9BVT8_PARPN|nr:MULTISPECIES: porin family protein [Paracoccus]ABL71164.1 putative outer membrane protein [Paracoccus denitrificans PD1222]MBB4628231.1 opacity protein-like surface antigen [Paracoccus denitrificans]MCU7429295.1 porin family protein [Paracoccus denitrificans]QAR27810.1 porin family protein [Paracoccus denitrificans]QLH14938.1 porin family protein [Paracoccus pantotrophus]
MMKRLGVMSIAALAIGGAANAGSYTAPVIEAPVIAPAAPALSHSNTWTGFYAGMQMSYSDFSVNRDGVDDATGGVYGIHAGYNHQLHNNMVIGGEITFDHSSADNDVWQVERLMTVRAKVGYAHNNWLVYGLAGYAHVRTEGADRAHGKSGGAVFGIGADYAVSDKWLVGGSWEGYRFSDFKNDPDNMEVDGGSVRFRVSYRF